MNVIFIYGAKGNFFSILRILRCIHAIEGSYNISLFCSCYGNNWNNWLSVFPNRCVIKQLCKKSPWKSFHYTFQRSYADCVMLRYVYFASMLQLHQCVNLTPTSVVPLKNGSLDYSRCGLDFKNIPLACVYFGNYMNMFHYGVYEK